MKKVEWLPLGVFALTDGSGDVEDSTLFLQLAISKERIIAGTLRNTATPSDIEVEGTVDEKGQRAAWGPVGKEWPVMETGQGAQPMCENAEQHGHHHGKLDGRVSGLLRRYSNSWRVEVIHNNGLSLSHQQLGGHQHDERGERGQHGEYRMHDWRRRRLLFSDFG